MGVINNVTRRATKAILNVEEAKDIMSEILFDNRNKNDLLDAMYKLDEAQKYLCLILNQDNKATECED